MNVLVIGAGGKTGRQAVEAAIAAGHRVTAFVHDPSAYDAPSPAVRVVGGDATDAAAVDAAMAGQQGVIDSVGGDTPFLNTTLERDVARAVLSAMRGRGVRRLVAVSVLGAGESIDQAGFFYHYLLIPTFLRGAVKDKEAMEREVEAAGDTSGIDFVLVRPPVLTDGDATGRVRVVGEGETAGKITRADLGRFLVERLAGDEYLGRAITVENAD